MKITAKSANEVAVMVSQSVKNLNAKIAELEGSNNPQTILILKEKIAERYALNAVLMALNGNRVPLNILAAP